MYRFRPEAGLVEYNYQILIVHASMGPAAFALFLCADRNMEGLLGNLIGYIHQLVLPIVIRPR